MSKNSPDDQIRFLLSCVRHSSYGKINFAEVAEECGSASKGAATKRYNRLVSTHSGGTKSEKSDTPKRKTKAEISQAAEAKRRKLEGDMNDPAADDEEAGCGTGGQVVAIKQEPGQTHAMQTTPTYPYYSPYTYSPDTCTAWSYPYLAAPAMSPTFASAISSISASTERSVNVLPQTSSIPPVIKIEDDNDHLEACRQGTQPAETHRPTAPGQSPHTACQGSQAFQQGQVKAEELW